MVTEDYVSFETAKLLKEKGFDERCFCFYEDDGKLYNDMGKYFPDGMNNSEHEREFGVGIAAPSLQMAAKWLRKVQKIYIDIGSSVVYVNEDGEIKFDRPNYTWDIICLENGETLAYSELATNYDSYEQALETAIVYSLKNLI